MIDSKKSYYYQGQLDISWRLQTTFYRFAADFEYDLDIGISHRGPLTEKVQAAFFGLFDRSTKDRFDWLEPIEGRDSSDQKLGGACA